MLLLAIGLAGCGGGPPADLFIVKRAGSVPGAALTLRLTDDGGAYCNGLGRREITSAQLIEGRELRRLLDGDERDDDAPKALAPGNPSFPARGVSIFSYRVRSERGTVSFHESSRIPGSTLVPRVVKLTRDVARDSCKLPR
ncbi:MAG TPA: hypothetical protein VNT22_03915 [Baekduia sp.]|nr:hypothetical protein [Baekduia sp.]